MLLELLSHICCVNWPDLHKICVCVWHVKFSYCSCYINFYAGCDFFSTFCTNYFGFLSPFLQTWILKVAWPYQLERWWLCPYSWCKRTILVGEVMLVNLIRIGFCRGPRRNPIPHLQVWVQYKHCLNSIFTDRHSSLIESSLNMNPTKFKLHLSVVCGLHDYY